MVAPRKTRRVVCTIIRVPTDSPFEVPTDNRPSDRLPWWDPTIAELVTQLQDEVRMERRLARLVARTAHKTVADLEPASPATEGDWDWQEEPRWTWPNN